MAVKKAIKTQYGDTRDLYVRLNNFEQLANHGVPAIARFRGFISKKAFEDGKHFVQEWLVEFPADAPDKPWKAAYDALLALPEFDGATEA